MLAASGGKCKVGLETPETERITIPKPRPLPLPKPSPDREPVPAGLLAGEVLLLHEHHVPTALGEPRQQARFLCGLSSPAITQARLARNPLFGVLEAHRFADVLTWCQQQASSPGSG